MSSTFYHPTPLFPAVDVCTNTCLFYLSITWNISRSKLESWRRFLGFFPDVYEKSSRYRCMIVGSGCDFKTKELPLRQLSTQYLKPPYKLPSTGVTKVTPKTFHEQAASLP